jgi:hypothetical protein
MIASLFGRVVRTPAAGIAAAAWWWLMRNWPQQLPGIIEPADTWLWVVQWIFGMMLFGGIAELGVRSLVGPRRRRKRR